MRDLILLAGAAIALSACNSEPSAQERAAAEQNVTSLVVATNDLTAIDAATGEDADMAADVAFMPEIGNQPDGNQPDGDRAAPAADRPRPDRPRPSRASPTPPREPAPEPAEPESPVADEPESNSP